MDKEETKKENNISDIPRLYAYPFEGLYKELKFQIQAKIDKYNNDDIIFSNYSKEYLCNWFDTYLNDFELNALRDIYNSTGEFPSIVDLEDIRNVKIQTSKTKVNFDNLGYVNNTPSIGKDLYASNTNSFTELIEELNILATNEYSKECTTCNDISECNGACNLSYIDMQTKLIQLLKKYNQYIE